MKKFVIASDNLKWALDKIGEAVNPKSVLPALSNVLCKVTEGKIEMFTSDMELTICVAVEVATTKAPFEFLLPYERLTKWVGCLKSQPLSFEFKTEKKLHVSGEEDVLEFGSLNKVEDFLKIPSVPTKNSVTLPAEFEGLLHKSMMTVAKDEKRPALSCSCIDITGKITYLVSTDAEYMFRHSVDIAAETPDQLLISPKLGKAMEGIKADKLSWTASLICFQGPQTKVWMKRLDARYVNYNAAIPTNDPNCTIQRSVLLDALNKACLISSATKETNLKLKQTPGRIAFETVDEGFEFAIKGSFAGAYTGETEAILVNAKKLLTIMKQDDSESVRLHVYDPTKGIVVTSEDNDQYLGMIMPLKSLK